jgi:hypothetical protein
VTETLRKPGNVKIDHEWYRLAKDRNNQYIYQRRTIPAQSLNIRSNLIAATDSGILEERHTCIDGFGFARSTGVDDGYHYTINMFVNDAGDIYALPSAFYCVDKTNEQNRFYEPPSAVFELMQNNRTVTYFLQDGRLCKIVGVSAPKVYYTVVHTFDNAWKATDAVVFQNRAYIAMGGSIDKRKIVSVDNNGSGKARFTTETAHRLSTGDTVRIQKSSVTSYNGQWTVTVIDSTTFDVPQLTYTAPSGTFSAYVYRLTNSVMRTFDGVNMSVHNATVLNVSSVADNGSGKARITTTTSHGLSVGDRIFLFDFNVAAYNSYTTAGASIIYTVSAVVNTTTFDVEGLTFSGTATGKISRQDSDVYAEHLTVVGDLLVRAFQDIDGWKVSRADTLNSDVTLDANWTAGIGTLNVGTGDAPVTDLVTVGEGEVVLKAEGVYTYHKNQGAYMNEIPELEKHTSVRNGRGSLAYKGWLYIPTVIGVFRWQQDLTENISPARDLPVTKFTPKGPAGWLAGDTEALYVWNEPFLIQQNKNTASPSVKSYLDPDGTAPSDPGGDPTLDNPVNLNGTTTAGSLYIGSVSKWHRVYFEMDPYDNGLKHAGLQVASVSYWNGSAWVDESFIDYTTKRPTNTANPNTLSRDGNLIMKTNLFNAVWIPGGNVGGNQQTLSNSYYWRRIKFTANINVDIIINRILVGTHDEVFDMIPDPVSGNLDEFFGAGGVQSVLRFEDRGAKSVWQTTWAFSSKPELTISGNSKAGGATPTGCAAIIQPNVLGADAMNSRWLFLGGFHTNYLCPLGNGPNPAEAPGPHTITPETSPYFYIELPRTVFGLVDVPKIPIEAIVPSYRKDWKYFSRALIVRTRSFSQTDDEYVTTLVQETSGNDAGTKLGYRRTGVDTTSSNLTSRMLISGIDGLEFVFGFVFNSTQQTLESLPRLRTIVLRAIPKPKFSDVVQLTLELDDDTVLPVQTVRHYPLKFIYPLVNNLVPITFVAPNGDMFKAVIQSINERFVEGPNRSLKRLIDMELLLIDSFDVYVG